MIKRDILEYARNNWHPADTSGKVVYALCDEIERLHNILDEVIGLLCDGDLNLIERWDEEYEGWRATLLRGDAWSVTEELAAELANRSEIRVDDDGAWRGVPQADLRAEIERLQTELDRFSWADSINGMELYERMGDIDG